MAFVTVTPGRKLQGTLQVPPSKSYAHRALICAALSEGVSRVGPLQKSQDILATSEGLCALGANIEWQGDTAIVTGIRESQAAGEIDCRESGSTIRFLVPIALALTGGARFTGAPRLMERPMEPYRVEFAKKGISWKQADCLEVQGTLQSGIYSLAGNVSSQFVTGLLLALPLLSGDSEIRLTSPLESAAYAEMTLEVMRDFGVQARCEGDRFFIPGKQRYTARDYEVEGDYSQAAAFLCADALGSEVCLTGLKPDSSQADRAILPILESMGAQIIWEDGAVRVQADGLIGGVIDVSQCPDIGPLVGLMGAMAQGETRVVGASRLRVKECDRLSATVQELKSLGAQAEEGADEMRFAGVSRLKGGVVAQAHNDHRMAMLLCIASQVSEGVISFGGSECINKSYPGFYQDYIQLGGEIDGFGVR